MEIELHSEGVSALEACRQVFAERSNPLRPAHDWLPDCLDQVAALFSTQASWMVVLGDGRRLGCRVARRALKGRAGIPIPNLRPIVDLGRLILIMRRDECSSEDREAVLAAIGNRALEIYADCDVIVAPIITAVTGSNPVSINPLLGVVCVFVEAKNGAGAEGALQEYSSAAQAVATAVESAYRRQVEDYYGEAAFAQHGLAGGDRYRFFPEGRRQVVTLFSDVRNFTPLTSLFHDREELTQAINEFMAASAECVWAHQGLLDKFLGDGLMALFGVTTAGHEVGQCVVQACEAARAMRKQFQELLLAPVNGMLEERSEYVELDLGVGIDCGPALLGFFGSRSSRSYTAIGDSVNTAARLQSMAGKPNPDDDHDGVDLPEVLVGRAAWCKLNEEYRRQSFKRTPYRLTVKGKPFPIEAYGMLNLPDPLGT